MGEDEQVNVEEDLAKLEEIVGELENDQLALERSIELFEEGVELAEGIKNGLSEAEVRLKKVVEESDLDFEVEDFDL
ncbi:MAG: exodeoxyribonuclease VII small subunit [Candidatus Acetothermia bacterium]